MFKERANPFAKETPTSKDPINPGPRVKATALNSSLVTPRKIKVIAYQNAEKDCTLGSRYCTGSIYRDYCFAEYTKHSASNECICS